MNRQHDLTHFYELLSALEGRLGGKRRLSDCNGRMDWPRRGVYFFFEPGEIRSISGEGPRVVRVGTHGLKRGSKSTLWGRLSQHGGGKSGNAGNHRGSIFRLLVGVAIMTRDHLEEPRSWGKRGDAAKATADARLSRDDLLHSELALEAAVSEYIRSMPFLYLAVDDEPSPTSDRRIIERNSIGLLSNFAREHVDTASKLWLGSYCDREKVRRSELWNNNHVDEVYDRAFLHLLEGYVERAT